MGEREGEIGERGGERGESRERVWRERGKESGDSRESVGRVSRESQKRVGR